MKRQPEGRRPAGNGHELWATKDGLLYGRAVLDFAPRLDRDAATGQANRRGAGYDVAGTLADGTGYTLAWAHQTLAKAIASMDTRQPAAQRREIVEVDFHGARVAHALSERRLSVDLIRRRDPEALRVLAAAREGGAHVVIVRADGPFEVDADGVANRTVIFLDAFGDAVEEVRRSLWFCPDDGGGPDPDAAGAPRGLLPFGRARCASVGHLLAFVAWEVSVAALAGYVAQPLYALLGRTVSVPLAVPVALGAIVALAVGWLVWVKLVDAVDRRRAAPGGPSREELDERAMLEALAALVRACQRGGGDDRSSPPGSDRVSAPGAGGGAGGGEAEDEA